MISHLVILLTDALIFLLLLLSIVFGIYASRRAHLRRPWGLVVRSRVGVGSMVVLAFYLVVGLLDSIHFHPLSQPADGAAEQTRSSWRPRTSAATRRRGSVAARRRAGSSKASR